MNHHYDYIIIGSGFGGSVSALRLAEKGYSVLVIEKGKWFNKPEDFPKTNWNLRKWLWLPSFGWKGLFKLSFFRHVAVLSGTGVGGGSLVYANTLPIPGKDFFETGHWKGLANWESELKPFYSLAEKMLGSEVHPYMSRSDKAMLQLAKEMGDESKFSKPKVAVYFGQPEVTVPDPYFEGKGPERTGCRLCGGCMLGCRYNSKNTLDKNYLHLAQQLGVEIIAESEVTDVKPLNADGSEGYEVTFKSTGKKKGQTTIQSSGVVFSGGVLGTVSLLLKLKKKSLPNLSNALGNGLRTNSESLIGVTTRDKVSFSEGIAIGSIVEIDKNRHVEPVKYSEGAGFWRIFMAPMVQGSNIVIRIWKMILEVILHPVDYAKAFFVDDWSKRTHILLYMESIESTLRFSRNIFGGMKTNMEKGPVPTAFNPKAQEVAHKIEAIVNGKAMVMNTESLFGIPTTAHILGGACMGANEKEGVIDCNHRVFNYRNMFVCDGSAMSANPGVNPSLSITAMSERAMSLIPRVGEW